MDKENKFNKSNKLLFIKGEHGDIAVLHQIRSGKRNQSGQKERQKHKKIYKGNTFLKSILREKKHNSLSRFPKQVN